MNYADHAIVYFSKFDLYSKSDALPDANALTPYYHRLNTLRYVIAGRANERAVPRSAAAQLNFNNGRIFQQWRPTLCKSVNPR
jgi:hypothetical protein